MDVAAGNTYTVRRSAIIEPLSHWIYCKGGGGRLIIVAVTIDEAISNLWRVSSLRVWGLGPALVSRPTSHCPGNRCDEETSATKISAASETRFITSPWNVVRVPAKPLPEGCNLHL